MRGQTWLAPASALLLAVLPVAAHDSPDDVIHALTHRLEAHGASARLLTARAFEHQALRQWEAALADFAAALELQPHYAPALTGSAQVFLHQRAWAEATRVAREGLAQAEGAAAEGAFHALLARIHAGQEKWIEALADWRAALRSPQPEIDWYLGEAECLARLGRHDDQVNALARAMTRNPSVVLRRSWIRALVDAGQTDLASNEIARGLAAARWKSSWLLLHARVQAQRGEPVEAGAAAAAALTEIRGRLNPARADPWLEAEAAEAQALLGGQLRPPVPLYPPTGDAGVPSTRSHHHH